MKIEGKLADLGIELPAPSIPPTAPLKPWNISGNLIYLSGAGPVDSTGATPVGKVGSDFDTAEAPSSPARSRWRISARQGRPGRPGRVLQVVKVLGMVNCTDDYTDQPAVINGYSELFVELWGENGRHARSAVGMAQLPGGMPVEIEAILEFM